MALPFPLSKQDSEPTLPISNTPSSGTTTSTLPSSVALEESRQAESDPITLKHAKDLEAQPELKSGPGNQPRLARLPTWISFWLGYRKTPPPPEKNYIVWLWSFIGAFSCIAVIQALFGNVPYFVEKGVPSIVSLIDNFVAFVVDRFNHSGGNCYPTLRRHRISPIPAAPCRTRPHRRRHNRRLYHETLCASANRGTLRRVILACRVPMLRPGSGLHADDRDHAPSRWYVHRW